jgi:FSR family fosmidomycin resistance protein-like MFS transporter
MEKPLWMICTTHMFIEVYLLMQVALIPVIIHEFQLSLLEASLVATVPNFVALLMNIPSGFLADRFSPNRLLFASMVVEGLSGLLISQASNFWILVAELSILKISSPLYHISGLSQISRFARQEKIGRSIGFHNALGNLGTAAGLISLTVFLSTVGWRWTYLFWSAPVFVWGFVILTSSQLRSNRVEKTVGAHSGRFERWSLLFSSSFLILLAVVGVREVGSMASSTFMTTYFVETRGLSEAMASFIFGLGPFVGIVGSVSGGYMCERIGARNALSSVIVSGAISLFALSLSSQLYFLVILYLLYSFFASAVWSPMNTLVANTTPITERGLGYSVYFLMEGLLDSAVPTLAAGVIELTDVWFIFPLSVIFLIASVIVLQFLAYPKRH